MSGAARSTASVRWPEDLVPVHELGRGGMAVVTLALRREDFGVSTPVAVKRLLPELVSEPAFVEMFLDEARLLARMDHPNVVAFRGLRSFEDEPLLTLEYLEGLNASQCVKGWLRRDESLPLDHAVQIVLDALRGLGHAHALRSEAGDAERVVHRDVSPQNLFVGVDGRTRLIDFGVSRAEHREHRTRTGTVKGKFAYMAPEQLGSDYDHRVDLFAMGIVLFELLTSTRLFRGRDEREILGAVLQGEVPLVSTLRPDCPSSLTEVCRRALLRDPDERFPSADAMHEALSDALELPSDTPRRLGERVLEMDRVSIRSRRAALSTFRENASGERASSPSVSVVIEPSCVFERSGAPPSVERSSPSRSRVRAAPPSRWGRVALFVGVCLGASAMTWIGWSRVGGERFEAHAASSNDTLPKAHTRGLEPNARGSVGAPPTSASAPTGLAPADDTPTHDTPTHDATARRDDPTIPASETVAVTFWSSRPVRVRVAELECTTPCVLPLPRSSVAHVELMESNRSPGRVEIVPHEELRVDLDDVWPRRRARRATSPELRPSAPRFPTFE